MINITVTITSIILQVTQKSFSSKPYFHPGLFSQPTYLYIFSFQVTSHWSGRRFRNRIPTPQFFPYRPFPTPGGGKEGVGRGQGSYHPVSPLAAVAESVVEAAPRLRERPITPDPEASE